MESLDDSSHDEAQAHSLGLLSHSLSTSSSTSLLNAPYLPSPLRDMMEREGYTDSPG
jgi:hypothetical protein